MSTQNLQLKTKKELCEMAKAKNVKVLMSWLKADIIDAINNAQPAEKPEPAKTARRGEY